jgi:hypothetical protein
MMSCMFTQVIDLEVIIVKPYGELVKFSDEYY